MRIAAKALAPEQAERCGTVDYRADLYALGATMFKLLCGRAPLAAAPNFSPIDKLRLLATHRPPSLRTIRPDAPEALIQLVDGLLSTSPQERPASAAHVAEGLQNLAISGCLIDLIETAHALETNAAPAIASPLSKSMLLRTNPPTPVPQSTAIRGGNRWWLWVAAALVPFAFLGGYIIKFDTPDGQFIIESEVAGAQVRIAKAGTETKSFKVETGNSVTRLSAGKYEVVLDSPSDGFSIDRDSFVIAKGETVIARVRRTTNPMATGIILPSPPIESVVKSTDPVFDGKTLAEWLDIARREKEPKSWESALNAINALTDEKTKLELFGEIFAESVRRRNFVPIAQWSMHDAFAGFMVKELDLSDAKTRVNLLSRIKFNIPSPSLDPVWHWLDRLSLSDPNQSTALIRATTKLSESSQTGIQWDQIKIAYIVKQFPRLAALLDRDLVISAGSRSDLGGIRSHVLSVAFKHLENDSMNFADHVAAITVLVKQVRADEFSKSQIEQLSKRITTLLRQAWENRSIANIGYDDDNYSTKFSFGVGVSHSNRQQLCVPYLLNLIENYIIKGLTKRGIANSILSNDILAALSDLEVSSRKRAMDAWSELPREKGKPSTDMLEFNSRDFRLDDRYLDQLPKSESNERQLELDDLSVAYVLHRYAAFLILGEMPPVNATPDEVGEKIAELRELDTNQDWMLSVDEQLPEFILLPGNNNQAVSFGGYWTPKGIGGNGGLTADEVRARDDAKRREWAKAKFKNLDKNGDGNLSPEEAAGLDFAGMDTDKDGLISSEEYMSVRVLRP